jgi:hypothetical protein
MCSNEKIMKKFEFIMKNKQMKEHLALTPLETSSIFYQDNRVNKTLTLPHFQSKRCSSHNCYETRTMRCFPTSAPLCCPPMLPRTKLALQPPSNVKAPSRRALMELYTVRTRK